MLILGVVMSRKLSLPVIASGVLLLLLFSSIAAWWRYEGKLQALQATIRSQDQTIEMYEAKIVTPAEKRQQKALLQQKTKGYLLETLIPQATNPGKTISDDAFSVLKSQLATPGAVIDYVSSPENGAMVESGWMVLAADERLFLIEDQTLRQIETPYPPDEWCRVEPTIESQVLVSFPEIGSTERSRTQRFMVELACANTIGVEKSKRITGLYEYPSLKRVSLSVLPAQFRVAGLDIFEDGFTNATYSHSFHEVLVLHDITGKGRLGGQNNMSFVAFDARDGRFLDALVPSTLAQDPPEWSRPQPVMPGILRSTNEARN